MDKLWMVKLYDGKEKDFRKKRLVRVRVYEDYQHALSDVINGDSCLYDDDVDTTGVQFDTPRIQSASADDLGYGVDFHFYYPNGIAVVIEELMTEERMGGYAK